MLPAPRRSLIRRIAALYGVGVFLEWGLSISLMVLVFGETQNSLLAAAMLLCTQIAPNAVIATLAGALDRFAVRPIYVGALLVQAFAVAGIGLLGVGPALYALGFICGLGTAVGRAGLRTALGRLATIDPEAVRRGNAAIGLLRGPSGLLAPVAAGAAVAIAGPADALVVLGAGWAVAAVFAMRLPRFEVVEIASEDEDEPRTVRRGVLPVNGLLAAVAVVVCVFSVDEPVLLGFMQHDLHVGVAGYSAFFVAWGVGMCAGGLAFSRLIERPMIAIFLFGAALNALAHFGLFFAPTLGAALALAVIGGFGNGLDWTALATAVQEAAPRGQEARVGGRLETLATAGAGVGIVLGGLLAELFDARTVLLVPAAGGALLVAALAITVTLRLQRPPVRVALAPAVQGGVS
ncbi:MAG: MFS transporter [Patulibacter minatonensis]